MAHTTTLALLKRVLAQPTAPFREFAVRGAIARTLDDAGVAWFLDRAGNLIAGARSFRELKAQSARGSMIGLMAHMDHPGFHLGERIAPQTYRCEWLGGAPFEDFPGAKVRVYDAADPRRSIRGRITRLVKSKKVKPKLGDRVFEARFEEDLSSFSPLSFGAFDFQAFEKQGDRCVTRAADDLAGCVIALGALIDERKNRAKARRRLFAIFTRAEEVGFIGCLDLLRRRELPEKALYISLEASRQLPEAELGLGPVLRLGDRATIFDALIASAMHGSALELKTRLKSFRFQRRLLPGGTCEGTALTAYGYTTSALAVPLLNYHNQAFDGSKHGPRPEIISLGDTDRARRFCYELPALLPRHLAHAEKTKGRIDRNFSTFQSHLAQDKGSLK